MKRGKVGPDEKAERVRPGLNRRRDLAASKTASAKERASWASLGVALSALKILGSMAVVAFLLAGGFWAYRYACRSSYFGATDIRVFGNRTVSVEELVKAGGLDGAPNLFSINAEMIRRSLLEIPWIGDARISTRLPSTVSIEVVERRAAATLILDVPYLVDESGDVFKRFTAMDAVVPPVLTGFQRDEFSAKDSTASERLRDALDLARRYRRTSLEQIAPLSEVYREPDGGFSLVIGSDGVYVKLGKGPYRHKLNRLATLLSRLQRDGRVPAIVYLDNEVRPDRITVTPRPAPKETSARFRGDKEEKRLSKI
jgi:cell division protein FtsQ